MELAVSKLINTLQQYKIDAAMIMMQENRRYFAGFTGSAATVFIHPEFQYVITDFRYMEQARSQCPGFEIIDAAGSKAIAFVKDVCSIKSIKRLWFEEDTVRYREYQYLKENLQPVSLAPDKGVISSIRMIKTQDEILLIRKAAAIADIGFQHILNYIRPGITEVDIALELEFFLRKNGSDGLAFPIISASGLNSAMPHAQPTHKRLQKGEFLTLDYGCVAGGYCSDMTRTIAIGEPSTQLKEIYQITLDAQLKGLNALASGISGRNVDSQVRDYIESKGYREFFGHGLGHGVGLQIHEAPTLSLQGTEILQPGMVVTVEPGIYLPGVGGVRIEDLAVITERGCDNLTSSKKDLIIV